MTSEQFEQVKKAVEAQLDEKIKTTEHIDATVRAIKSIRAHIKAALYDAGHQNTADFIESQIQFLSELKPQRHSKPDNTI